MGPEVGGAFEVDGVLKWVGHSRWMGPEVGGAFEVGVALRWAGGFKVVHMYVHCQFRSEPDASLPLSSTSLRC